MGDRAASKSRIHPSCARAASSGAEGDAEGCRVDFISSCAHGAGRGRRVDDPRLDVGNLRLVPGRRRGHHDRDLGAGLDRRRALAARRSHAAHRAASRRSRPTDRSGMRRGSGAQRVARHCRARQVAARGDAPAAARRAGARSLQRRHGVARALRDRRRRAIRDRRNRFLSRGLGRQGPRGARRRDPLAGGGRRRIPALRRCRHGLFPGMHRGSARDDARAQARSAEPRQHADARPVVRKGGADGGRARAHAAVSADARQCVPRIGAPSPTASSCCSRETRTSSSGATPRCAARCSRIWPWRGSSKPGNEIRACSWRTDCSIAACTRIGRNSGAAGSGSTPRPPTAARGACPCRRGVCAGSARWCPAGCWAQCRLALLVIGRDPMLGRTLVALGLAAAAVWLGALTRIVGVAQGPRVDCAIAHRRRLAHGGSPGRGRERPAFAPAHPLGRARVRPRRLAFAAATPGLFAFEPMDPAPSAASRGQPVALHWQWSRMPELTSAALYAALAARQQAFAVEQDCAYLDADGLDLHAWHLLGWAGERATARARRVPARRRSGSQVRGTVDRPRADRRRATRRSGSAAR